MLNQYKVLPFSGPRYAENAKKLTNEEQGCAICGKPVRLPLVHTAVVVNGGDWAKTPEEAADDADPGYMGVWGIGPDCHRKHLIKE